MTSSFLRARLSQDQAERLHRMAANDAPCLSEGSYVACKAQQPTREQRFLAAHRIAALVRERHPRMQVKRLVPILWTAE